MNLRNHPFPVQAHFRSSLVLTFAARRAELAKLVPGSLSLDTLNDQWGFIAVAIVQTTRLRPAGWPAFLGNDFLLVGYRIFTRFMTTGGKNLRGLYILGSETDSRMMKVLGGMFTKYRYWKTDIRFRENAYGEEPLKKTRIEVTSAETGLMIHALTGDSYISLPAGSPFTDWKEARRFAGPLPFTFSPDTGTGKMLIVQGLRENWTPQPISVTEWKIPFVERLQLQGLTLANAFIIRDIPYQWKKGWLENIQA